MPLPVRPPRSASPAPVPVSPANFLAWGRSSARCHWSFPSAGGALCRSRLFAPALRLLLSVFPYGPRFLLVCSQHPAIDLLGGKQCVVFITQLRTCLRRRKRLCRCRCRRCFH